MESFTDISLHLVILLSIIAGLSGEEEASIIGWLAEQNHSHSQCYIQAHACDPFTVSW